MAGCCELAYYCVNGEIVTTEPGTKENPTLPPPGFSGGPWPTIKQAEAGCPLTVKFCGQNTMVVPRKLRLNCINKSARAALIPNSFDLSFFNSDTGSTTNTGWISGPNTLDQEVWFVHLNCFGGNYYLTVESRPAALSPRNQYSYLPVSPWAGGCFNLNNPYAGVSFSGSVWELPPVSLVGSYTFDAPCSAGVVHPVDFDLVILS